MKKIFTILIVFTLILYYEDIYALNVNVCEYSEDFIEWTKLSEDEKKALQVVPDVCKKDKKHTLINNITSNSYVTANDTYPSSYSLVDLGYVSSVKNQMSTGTCWAFTSNEMVESNLRMKKNLALNYSSRHIEYYTTRKFSDGINTDGLNRVVDSGGNFFMSFNYFKNNYGPILESDMPFENNMNILPLSSIRNKKVAADVNTNFILSNGNNGCTDSIKKTIKNHLINYGAVGAMINMKKPSIYYNDSTASYYYDETDKVNHAITIVGWDDNYQVSNFNSSKRPPGPGAWLIKNSYGTSFGNNGYFYISYYDTMVCRNTSGIYDVDFELPDKLYTYDKYGYNTSLILSDNSQKAYVATKFNKPASTEYLSEITVGSYEYAKVDLYVIPTNTELNINNATKVGSITIPYGGYSTYKLNQLITLPDTSFYIIAKYTYLSTGGPAVSIYIENSPWDIVNANYGESFLSVNGTNYTDLITSLGGVKANAAITAGIITERESITTDNSKTYIAYNNKNKDITIPITTTKIKDNSNLNIKIIQESDKSDKSKDFNISGKTINNNKANINIIAKSTAKPGNYIVQVSYKDKTVEVKLIVKEYKYIETIETENIILEEGNTFQIVPKITPLDAENKNLKMTSTNTTIFTVDNGKIKGLKEGIAKLIIESTDGSNIRKEIQIMVIKLFTKESKYRLDNKYIINVLPDTKLKDVLSNFEESNKIKIYNRSGKEETINNIGTGYKAKKSVSGTFTEYIFIILGDVSGDGTINSADLLKVRQHLLGVTKLQKEYFLSADITGEKSINSADLLKLRQHLLGIKKIN